MNPRIRSASGAFRQSYWVPALAIAATLVFLAWLMAGPVVAQEGIDETENANLMLFADGVPAEGGDPVTIVAGLRDPAGPEGVSVTLTTRGTATGDDYTLSASVINIAPGSTAGLATITATDDALDDDGETIILSAAASSSSLASIPLSLTIMDNDDGAFVITPRCNPLATSDYDRNNNGLIDVCNLAQFNAIRWDTSANGHNVHSSGYRAAYPNATGGMGCPWGTCKGYELTANLDFDTNGNGRADAGDAYWNGGQGWTPFAFRGVLDGNHHSISNLFIDTSYSKAGLFSTLSRDGVIHDVKLKSVDIDGDAEVGGLVGENSGRIFGVSVSGTVSGTSAVGGLVGAATDTSRIIANVATASVTGSRDNAGGLVGHNNGEISTSYAIGWVSGSAANIGGLVGRGESNLVSDSYFDTVTSGQTSSAGGVGKTSSELQEPTGYAGIYADWKVDVNGDELMDDPWCFGTASDYPNLKPLAMPCPNLPAPVPADKIDYDTDDDGLIEVSNLAQLSAIRLNITGDGQSFDNGSKYREAYPDAADFMGCAVRGNSYFGRLCKGYELTTDLDFDTNGNGWLDSGDWNGGRWEPINGGYGGFRAVFDGNGYTIRNMVAQGRREVGLFRSLHRHGVIRNVRLESVDVRGSVEVGGLVGRNYGTISGSGVSGSVYGSTSVGGLVGSAGPSSVIAGSHSTASVTLGSGGDKGGGLVGSNQGAIRGSYAVGAVSGNAYVSGLRSYREPNNVGGLVGYSHPTSVIIASYAIGEVSVSGQNIGGLVGHHAGTVIASYWNTVLSRASGAGGVGKTTTELQSPTGYTGIYAGWNVDLDGDNSVDNPWDFGTSSEYPVLKYGDISVAGQRALMPPVPAVAVLNPLEDVTIVHGSGTQEVSLSGVFSDADGDSVAGLTITAASSDETVATVSVASDYSTLTVAAQDWGRTTITVTADDGNGGTAADSFTVKVKDAPAVYRALADVSGLVEGTTQEISLSSPYSVFFDGDGEDLTITAASSDETKATVAVAADGSKLTLTGVAEGTATITVTAEDPDGNQVNDTFDVSVSKAPQLRQANRVPTVTSAIGDATIINESGTHQESLSGVFSDADNDSLIITASSSDNLKAIVDVATDYSTLTVVALSRGMATITVTADDGNGGTVSDTFTVTVKSAPTVASAISDVSGLEEDATQDVSLSGVFSDADGDTLTISATSSDETKATVSVASDGSHLTLTGVAEGTSTITVTAQDSDGNQVSDDFEVPVAEKYTALIAQMYEWRNDPQWVSHKDHTDRWDRALLAFGETVADATLTPMSAAEAQELADRGSAWTRWVEVAKALNELESAPQLQQANRAPTVSSAIGDATIVNESGTHQESLSGVFSDADNDSLTITASSSDDLKATVDVATDYSSLTVTAKARGAATITVTADDGNGGTVQDTFTVTVKSAPTVASALADVSGLEEAATQDVSLSGVFSDPDSDTLTISATSSDEAKATVSAASDGSKLTLTGVAEGTATITVTAQDSDGNRVSDTIDVAVAKAPQLQQANRAPTVTSAIGDATIINESGTHQESLSGVFTDADSDSLTITAASSDETKATVSVAPDYSSLTVTAKARGAATITVTADDGNGGTVSDTFTVTVKAAPTVASALADVSGLEEAATQDVSLSGVFSDADGDTLTVTAASSDETKATVSVASDGSNLTLTGVAEGTATITVTAQDSDGNRVSDTFDAPVAEKYTALIAQMYEWRNDPQWVSHKPHTDRWDRALLAFGETVADTTLTPMSAAEAQGYAAESWGERWVLVAAALQELESAPQLQQANRAPTVSSAIGDATIVNESGTHQESLSGVFSDADNDSLTITAASSNEAVATASVVSGGSNLTVMAKARGAATITVTADDGNGGTVQDTFTVTVKSAPTVASALADVSGLEEAATQDISLSGVFSDADGDTLTVTVASSDETKATVSVASDGSNLTLTGVAEGTATITVTAQDSDGNRVSDTFDVAVTKAPELEEQTSSDIVARYDANGDGSIDVSEYTQAVRDYVAKKITYEEFMEVYKAYTGSG